VGLDQDLTRGELAAKLLRLEVVLDREGLELGLVQGAALLGFVEKRAQKISRRAQGAAPFVDGSGACRTGGRSRGTAPSIFQTCAAPALFPEICGEDDFPSGYGV